METVNGSWSQKAFMGVAALLAALYVAVGALVWVGMGNPGDYPRFALGIVGLSAGAMILVGLWVGRRSPLLGVTLVAVGAVPLAILFFWAIVPLILLLLIVLFWSKARWLARRAA